jgi:hypothetical protein
MALNISIPSTAITELESYQWYNAAGVSLKDIVTSVMGLTTASTAWTDISDYVVQIGISGSIENMSGQPGANTATIQLDNRDKRFSDLFSTGPYYGNLVPGKRVKIELTVAGSTVPIFNGRVSGDGFAEIRSGNEGIAQITVPDTFDWLQKKKFDKDYYYTNKKMIDESDAANSLLHILLMTHGGLSAAEVVTNGDVSYLVPYTVFKEGESIQYRIQELARASLAQYCGFRYDGKFVMESRLITGWSVPASEYVLQSSNLEVDIHKTLTPLFGNRVKVRGDKIDFVDSDMVLWELRKVKPVGKNLVFPSYCWETVGTGAYFLCDPAASPPSEYWAQYEIEGGEIIHVQSVAMSQTIYEGSAFALNTTGTDLTSEETKGKLVLQNSQPQSVNVLNLQIKGKAAIRRSIGKKSEADIKQLKLDAGVSDDDLNWGRIGIDSNASSILAYGQTDLVVDSEYITDDGQLIKILDWYLKYGKDPKHHFAINNLPFLAFIQPGAVLTFGLSELGYSALTEVSRFNHQITPDGAKTQLELIETPTGWTVSCAVSVETIIAAPVAGTGGIGQGQAGAATNISLTIGSSGIALPVDFICDGADDQSELNTAIEWVANNGGGRVYLVGSTFNTTAVVSLLSNVEVVIDSGVTVQKDHAGHAFEAVGTAATHMSNVILSGGGTVRATGDSTATSLVYFDYADDLSVDGIRIKDGFGDGLYIINCTNGRIGGTVKITDCLGTGLKIIGSVMIIGIGITITECAIGYECWPTLTTNKIDRGDCENATAPMFAGETAPLTVQCTWARSNTQKYAGTNSFKYTDTSGAMAGYASLTSSMSATNMHGLTAGKIYRFSMQMFIPSAGMLASDIMVTFYQSINGVSWDVGGGTDTDMGWTISKQPAAVYDAWQEIQFIAGLSPSATGVGFTIAVGSTAPLNSVLYVDEVVLYEYDETDQGCQLANSTVADCTDRGVLIVNSHTLIQNNQITGNTNKGLVIAAGYRNIVTGNWCFNNGADTDIANTNRNNFYDEGIATQVS